MAMVGSPQPELHRILRRLDFPQSAKEALACLGIDLNCSKLHVIILLYFYRTIMFTTCTYKTAYLQAIGLYWGNH